MSGKNDEICIINNTKRGNSKNDDSANYDFTIEFNYGSWDVPYGNYTVLMYWLRPDPWRVFKAFNLFHNFLLLNNNHLSTFN